MTHLIRHPAHLINRKEVFSDFDHDHHHDAGRQGCSWTPEKTISMKPIHMSDLSPSTSEIQISFTHILLPLKEVPITPLRFRVRIDRSIDTGGNTSHIGDRSMNQSQSTNKWRREC
jgi:hypothetical protein